MRINLPTHDADGHPIDYAAMFTAPLDWAWNLPAGTHLWESA